MQAVVAMPVALGGLARGHLLGKQALAGTSMAAVAA